MKRIEREHASVRAFLARHRIPTLNLAGILANEPHREVFVDDVDSPAILLVKGGRFWYVHAEDGADLEPLFAEMGVAFHRFSGVWAPLAARIKARFPLVWDAPCALYLLPDEAPVAPRPGSLARNLRVEDAELIDAHYAYRNPHSLEKIHRCLAERPSSGICVDGSPVCWLLVHEDDSLGIMYTMEDHRRKGYALDVSLDLVARRRAEGKTPFLQIRDDNAMSPGLARRCGFVEVGACDWFGVMVGRPRELVEGMESMRRRVVEEAGPEACGDIPLIRFLEPMHPDPSRANPVEVLDEAQWRALAGTPPPPGSRLLGDPRRGTVAALFLDEEEGGFELLACSSLAPDFLQDVVERARLTGLDTALVHAREGEAEAYEAAGFIRA